MSGQRPHKPLETAAQSGSEPKGRENGRKEPVWDRSKPFPPGHELSTTHGAFSPSKVEPRAAELVPVIYELHPHLDESRDALAVHRLAVTLARIERVDAWLAEQDDPVFADVARGKAHRVFERVERWQRSATALERQLAMSPLTRAQLGITTAHAMDLASLWAAEDENTLDGEAEDA